MRRATLSIAIRRSGRRVLAVLCAIAIGPAEGFAEIAVAPPAAVLQASSPPEAAPAIPLDQLDSLVARRRLVGMLQRRGFNYDEIRPVVDEVLGYHDESTSD